MKILAIETSCDETAIALVRFQNSRPKILSNIISSQVKIHRKWGGVVPSLAKREHQKNLVPVLVKALREAGLLKRIKDHRSKIKDQEFEKLKDILIREEHLYKKLKQFLANYQKPKIDASTLLSIPSTLSSGRSAALSDNRRVDLITVTAGPGLEPALWVGVNFARALSYFWRLPIIPVNHIEAHIFANFIGKSFEIHDKTIFPVVCLSASGGHTQLLLIKDYGKYKLLGETRDDTAGECFDKVARMLGLGYPGGPVIERLAKKGNPEFFNFPRPMIYTKDYDFSFSGLKTAVLYFLKKHNKNIIKKYKNDICASFQQAVVDVLVAKTVRAVKEFKVKTIILAGGVAANEKLSKQLQARIQKEIPDTKYLIPDTRFCTDNAAMVAMAAYFHWLKGETKNWKEIKADANLKI